MTNEECQVADCAGAKYVRGYCLKHYTRMLRYGTTGGKPQPPSPLPAVRSRGARGTCIVPNCGRTDKGVHGYCDMHYSRAMAHGSPDVVISMKGLLAGDKSPYWQGDDASYNAVHFRLRKSRGRANQYGCVSCDKRAAHWAYDYTDPNQKLAPGKGAYSSRLECYRPMCVSCHRNFDNAQRKASA